MKLEKLQFVVEDGVGIITMNYMKNLNAIDDQMADELMYVVDTCENDPNVKVVECQRHFQQEETLDTSIT